MSNFSYQVAAGRTMSENSPELVIRKSMLTSKSVFPSGGTSVTFTSSGCQEFFASVITWLSAPMRCLAKYSCPLPLSPNKLERQLKNTLGKFRGSFGFSIAQSIFPRSEERRVGKECGYGWSRDNSDTIYNGYEITSIADKKLGLERQGLAK